MALAGQHFEARPAVKSPAAFRTIAEVAEELDLPAHVLRFWESKFPQVRPLKRRGGRRYYRPEDVDLLRCIRRLLYSDGYTIKGVQKLLREGSHRLPDPSSGPPATAVVAPVIAPLAQPVGPVEAVEPASPGPPVERPSVPRRQVLIEVLSELEALRDLLRRHGF
jgi:DNA-binding transcriptional MerR regulator